MRKFRLALAAAGALLLAAAGLALATGGDSGTKSSRLHVSRLAPTGVAFGRREHCRQSNAQTTRIALPGLTRPLRDMPRDPGRQAQLQAGHAGAVPVTEGMGASGGEPTGARPDEGRHGRHARRRSRTSTGSRGSAAVCHRTPTATWARTTTCSSSTSTSRSTRRRGPRSASTQPGNALWAGNPNAPVCAANNDGDPIVLYDQYAGRWFASQFAFPNFPNGPFYQCVAVSTTNDPSGTWNGYEYLVSATKLNDYPKFGVWPAQNAYMAHDQPVHRPGLPVGRRRRPRLRARQDDRRPAREDGLQGHVRRRTGAVGRHAPGRSRRRRLSRRQVRLRR